MSTEGAVPAPLALAVTLLVKPAPCSSSTMSSLVERQNDLLSFGRYFERRENVLNETTSFLGYFPLYSFLLSPISPIFIFLMFAFTRTRLAALQLKRFTRRSKSIDL